MYPGVLRASMSAMVYLSARIRAMKVQYINKGMGDYGEGQNGREKGRGEKGRER